MFLVRPEPTRVKYLAGAPLIHSHKLDKAGKATTNILNYDFKSLLN
jgi:hypothetical protein